MIKLLPASFILAAKQIYKYITYQILNLLGISSETTANSYIMQHEGEPQDALSYNSSFFRALQMPIEKGVNALYQEHV